MKTLRKRRFRSERSTMMYRCYVCVFVFAQVSVCPCVVYCYIDCSLVCAYALACDERVYLCTENSSYNQNKIIQEKSGFEQKGETIFFDPLFASFRCCCFFHFVFRLSVQHGEYAVHTDSFSVYRFIIYIHFFSCVSFQIKMAYLPCTFYDGWVLFSLLHILLRFLVRFHLFGFGFVPFVDATVNRFMNYLMVERHLIAIKREASWSFPLNASDDF